MPKLTLIAGTLLILIMGGILLFLRQQQARLNHQETPLVALASPTPTSRMTFASPPPAVSPAAAPAASPTQSTSTAVIYPIAEFTSRITKKPFGLYVNPQNSPVSPERFTGWHSGSDIEYGDVAGDVPVVAIADGTVVASRAAAGYGGVVVIRHVVSNETATALYGHLDPASMIASGARVAQGQQIGILGDGYSPETDNERKHLHFAVHKGGTVNLLGYVQSEAALTGWYNPATWLQQ